MSDLISRKEALAFPFANGKYDHKHANEHFILGCESYKEWLEQLPPSEPQGFEDYLNQYLGENDQMIIGKNVYEELKYEVGEYDELMRQYKHLRKYASDLETKLSVEQTEWISVKDRLPEEHRAKEEAEERYLVTYTYTDCKGNHICIGVDLYSDGKWWHHSEDEYEHVVAWMPLPSPYKGE